MDKIHLSFLVALFIFPTIGFSQCATPFGLTFTQKTKTTIDFRWTDSNPSVLGWDIEIVKKGNLVLGIPVNPAPVPTTVFRAENLEPSTFYEIYIRTVCQSTQRSNWNGPFVVSTVLSNPTLCSVDLDMKDNGTETFLIDITSNGILGQDVFLSSVETIIEHEWPADIRITLTNPAGNSVILSNHHGTGGKHFGNPEDDSCISTTNFSDQACFAFNESKPPFIGYFLPFNPLSDLHDNTQAQGVWKLTFHDRANFHRGKLKYLNILLTGENCLPPLPFFLSDIKSDRANISWTHHSFCLSVKITVKEKNSLPGQEKEYFLNCLDENFVIPDLTPETEYEIFIQSVCSQGISPSGCVQMFKTNCKAPSQIESFNQETLCTESCRFDCNLIGFWQNSTADGKDWIVWQGATDTDNTGPESDITGFGKYIYLESQPDLCTQQIADLISGCLQVVSNSDGCDLSFYYHMFGSGTGKLSLEISLDNGTSWTTLWSLSGDQGNSWQRVLISLEEYHGLSAIFRFRGETTESAFGDMAIDQIEFFGSTEITTLYSYFSDVDGDGFGNTLDKILICQDFPPSGYVHTDGDCDDHNPEIYPGQTEISCNIIDENCNGSDDDQDPTSTLSYTFSTVNETCKGEKNGSVSLNISGGVPPYNVLWNTGHSLKDLVGVGAGIYFCTISDAGNCSVRTEFIQVTSEQSIQYVVTNIVKPTCSGQNNGSIFINHSGGQSPFFYKWSNGMNTKDLLQIGEGLYTVTISDINGCSIESQSIQVTSLPGLTVGATAVKHPGCSDKSDGQLSLGVIDGAPPYRFLWEGGQTSANISGLSAGNYSCTVTDNNQCHVVYETILSAPDSIKIQVLSTEAVRCFGESDGIIKTHTTGGTPPYLYFWSHSAFEDDLFNLEAGLYSLTVTDKNACTNVLQNVPVRQPEPLISNVNNLIPATCISGYNGSIEVSTTGGVSPYHYSWNELSASDTSLIQNLQSGIYSVVVFDENGCKFNLGSIFLPYENKRLEFTSEVLKVNQCSYDTHGQIAASVISPTLPLDFNWSTGLQHIIQDETDTISLLPSGIYSVTVTDKNGCTGNLDSLIIPEIQPIFYQLTEVTKNNCIDDSTAQIKISVSNAQGPYTVIWSNGSIGTINSDLPNGLYSGSVIDSAGCIHTISPVEITSVSALQVSTLIKNTTNESDNGEVCLVISGGLIPYTVKWDEKITNHQNQCAESLKAGLYSATVTDHLFCETEITFRIEKSSATNQENTKHIFYYPNPVFTILYPDHDILNHEISIFDITGKTVFQKKSGEKLTGIAVESWPSGVYLILTKGKDESYTYQKILKL